VSTTEPAPSAVRVGEARLPTVHGEFTLVSYRLAGGDDQAALVVGDPAGDGALVRIHSECLTGDVFGSTRCDCGDQLQQAMAELQSVGRGVIVYMRGHEGRGIGLAEKVRAYALQDGGLDTVDANLALGHPVDARHYDGAGAVLAELGVSSVRLMTNNPTKAEGLAAAGIPVTELVPVVADPHHERRDYLHTKAERMGHVGL